MTLPTARPEVTDVRINPDSRLKDSGHARRSAATGPPGRRRRRCSRASLRACPRGRRAAEHRGCLGGPAAVPAGGAGVPAGSGLLGCDHGRCGGRARSPSGQLPIRRCPGSSSWPSRFRRVPGRKRSPTGTGSPGTLAEQRWPEYAAAALSYGVRCFLTLVHESGPMAFTRRLFGVRPRSRSPSSGRRSRPA